MQMPKQIINVLALAAAACHVLPAADLLTVDQAIEIALGQNRALQNTALEALKARDNVDANRSRQFPSFSLQGLGAQQLQSFDFTIEKGKLGDYPGAGPLPGEDVHLKSPMQPSGLLITKVSQPLSSLIRI